MDNFKHLNIKPLVCPICGNTELFFVTEYHKCIKARLLSYLLFFASFLGFLIYLVSSLEDAINNVENHTSLLIPIVCLFLFISIKSYILYYESKTHIKAICSKCSRFWNVD